MNLGKLLGSYMRDNRLSLRDLERETHIDHTTLHRVVQNKSIHANTLLKVLVWIGGSSKQTLDK